MELRHLGRRHPDAQRWLLHDISLAIHPGQRIALVGPSGSGKTLLLRAMVLLDPLDAGELLWRGKTLQHDSIPLFRRQAIYLQQRPSLQNDTVEAALREPFTLKAHRTSHFDSQRVLHLLNALGRDADFLQKHPRDLSGGERQITALVRAIQLAPTLLLLDEPTASLDAPTAAAAECLLTNWAQEAPDRAIVWVTHDSAQAHRVAQEAITMHAGSIRTDPPSDT